MIMTVKFPGSQMGSSAPAEEGLGADKKTRGFPHSSAVAKCRLLRQSHGKRVRMSIFDESQQGYIKEDFEYGCMEW